MLAIGIEQNRHKKLRLFLSTFPPQVMQPPGHPPGTSSANLLRIESSLPTISSFSAKSSTETSATASRVTPQSSETPDKSTSSSRGSRGTPTIHAATTTNARPTRGGSSIDVSSMQPGATEGSHGTAPPATTTKAAEGSQGTAPPATTTKATGGSTPETGTGR